MTANEAFTAGLVTRTLWPDRFQIESLPSIKAMSNHSLQVTLLFICLQFITKDGTFIFQ